MTDTLTQDLFEGQLYEWVEEVSDTDVGTCLLAHALVYAPRFGGWKEYDSQRLPLDIEISSGVYHVPPEVTFAKGEQAID
jgi:hypothetical protein